MKPTPLTLKSERGHPGGGGGLFGFGFTTTARV
jgi:hypothetical protein